MVAVEPAIAPALAAFVTGQPRHSPGHVTRIEPSR